MKKMLKKMLRKIVLNDAICKPDQTIMDGSFYLHEVKTLEAMGFITVEWGEQIRDLHMFTMTATEEGKAYFEAIDSLEEL